jgi:hypothetical protein
VERSATPESVDENYPKPGGAADSIKPGVERSATPGTVDELFEARGAAESGINAFS